MFSGPKGCCWLPKRTSCTAPSMYLGTWQRHVVRLFCQVQLMWRYDTVRPLWPNRPRQTARNNARVALSGSTNHMTRHILRVALRARGVLCLLALLAGHVSTFRRMRLQGSRDLGHKLPYLHSVASGTERTSRSAGCKRNKYTVGSLGPATLASGLRSVRQAIKAGPPCLQLPHSQLLKHLQPRLNNFSNNRSTLLYTRHNNTLAHHHAVHHRSDEAPKRLRGAGT